LMDAAPQEASRPLTMVLLTMAAFLVLVSNWKHAVAWAMLATAAALVAEVLALRSALHIPLSAVLFAMWTAVAFRWLGNRRSRREVRGAPSNIPQTP
jgi:hypothetical protein